MIHEPPCEWLLDAQKDEERSGCVPNIRFVEAGTYWIAYDKEEPTYEPEEFNVAGYYITSCDDTLRVPVSFCPGCGTRLNT